MESINHKNIKKIRNSILNKTALFENFEIIDFKDKKFDILLVDDDHVCTQIFLLAVADLNIFNKIVTEQESTEALEYLKNIKNNNDSFPNIIFVDINMPIMNGYKFLEEYNKTCFNENTLIIFFSSYKPELDKLSEQKNIAYLEKPFDLNDFLTIIKEKGF